MSLEITTQDVEGIQIVNLHGQLTIGPEDLAFRAELDRLVKTGKVQIALDFSNLRHLDTTGLGTLLEARSTLQKAGGKLAVFELKTTHIQLLAAARLAATFEVFHDEHDAIDSFFSDRTVNRFDVLAFVESQKQKPAEPSS